MVMAVEKGAMFFERDWYSPSGIGFWLSQDIMGYPESRLFSDNTSCLGYYPLSVIWGFGSLRYEGHIDTAIQL